MDAVKYIKEKERMCNSYGCGCTGCQLWKIRVDLDITCSQFVKKFPETVVYLVERWSKDHPVLTNEQKFREVFGETHSLVKASSDWWVAEYNEPGKE